MSRISLRQLAKQYADGSLDQASYRRARADYLDAILKGNETPGSITQASYTSPKAVAGEETVTAASLQDEQKKRQYAAQDSAPAEHLQTRPIQLSDHSRNPVFISAGIITAVLVLIIAGSLLLGGDDSGGNRATTGAANTAQQSGSTDLRPLAETDTNAALVQLQEFLDSPRWSQQALDDFADRWQALPQQQRETALQTTLARQLGDALYSQLLEERALEGLDNNAPESLAGQEKIINFARDIGLEDRRLEVGE